MIFVSFEEFEYYLKSQCSDLMINNMAQECNYYLNSGEVDIYITAAFNKLKHLNLENLEDKIVGAICKEYVRRCSQLSCQVFTKTLKD